MSLHCNCTPYTWGKTGAYRICNQLTERQGHLCSHVCAAQLIPRPNSSSGASRDGCCLAQPIPSPGRNTCTYNATHFACYIADLALCGLTQLTTANKRTETVLMFHSCSLATNMHATASLQDCRPASQSNCPAVPPFVRGSSFT